jgi:hypothetical protein
MKAERLENSMECVLNAVFEDTINTTNDWYMIIMKFWPCSNALFKSSEAYLILALHFISQI